MLELFQYGARHRVRGSVAMAVGVALLAGIVLWIYPSMQASVNLDQLMAAYPEPVLKAFGVETLSTLAGFLSVELYSFAWVILFGLYTAYAAASMVADAVEDGRMDLWLSLPIRRRRLLTEQYLTLLVPILVVNAVTPVVIYAGAALVNEPISTRNLVMVHVLSVPYLLATAAIGLVFGVVFTRSALAERLALALVFALFLIQSLLTGTDYAWAGLVSPTHYYDVTAILVHGEYDYTAAVILLVTAAVLVAVAAAIFSRRDVG